MYARRALMTRDLTVSRSYDRLLRFVKRRVSTHADAEDVVQEAFARMKSANAGVVIESEDAYLRVVANNLLRDRKRSAAVQRTMMVEASPPLDVAAPDPSPERVVDGRLQIRLLEKALAELSDKRRAALILYRFEGLSRKEIAEMLGISVSMVEKHIKSALLHCHQRLADANADL